jgi:hypothetical protein
MSDDKSKQGYQDDSKIARDEYAYWCRKWKITRSQLHNAITETSSHAVSVVRSYLVQNGDLQNEEE